MYTLFDDIATLKQFADLNSAVRYQAIKPSILHATTKYLIPAIGNEYYTYLLTSDSAGDVDLIKKLRTALASLVMYEYSFITEVQMTDAGLRRGHDDSLPGAFKYQVQEFRKALIERGFTALDDALQLLETMAKDDEASTWVSSTHFTDYTALFIKNGSDLHSVMNQVLYPHRFYILLRSWIKNVQQLAVKKLITPSLYTALLQKNQSSDPQFSTEEKELLELLKAGIAHLAVARGASAIINQMDENGIHILSSSSESTNALGKRSASPAELLNHLIGSYEKTARDWFDAAIEYLDEKASTTVFPEWYNYKQSLTSQPECDSNNYNGIFSI